MKPAARPQHRQATGRGYEENRTMPHVIVKLWSGKLGQQKALPADAVTKAVMTTTGSSEDAVSVSIKAFAPADWTERVYRTGILHGPGKLHKAPGYNPP